MATFQVLGPDSVKTFVKVSSTQIKLPSGSRVTVGGQQYLSSSDLFVTIGSSGAGGLDTGSFVANTLYYIYGIVSAGVLALVASTSSSAPTGFSPSTLLSAFYTDGSAQVGALLISIKPAISDWVTFTPTITATANPTTGTVTFNVARWRRVGGTMELEWDYAQSAAGTDGTGTYQFLIPAGQSIDTTILGAGGALGSVNNVLARAWGVGLKTGAVPFTFNVEPTDSTHLFMIDSLNNSNVGGSGANSYFGYTSFRISFRGSLPISNWATNLI
jgi:hypothetical protein